MKVGDLVWGSPYRFGKGVVGIIVGINPLDGRFMVQWTDMPKPYPEPKRCLEVISASR